MDTQEIMKEINFWLEKLKGNTEALEIIRKVSKNLYANTKQSPPGLFLLTGKRGSAILTLDFFSVPSGSTHFCVYAHIQNRSFGKNR